MATTEELLARQKELTARIAAASKVDITTTSASKRLAAMKATEKDRAELAEINRQLSGKPKTPPKKKVTAPVDQGLRVAENAPAGITPDVAADLAAVGFDVSNEAIFRDGGIGTTAVVYFGEENKPTGGLKFKGGKPISSVVPTTGMTSKVITDFWKDEGLQNKIIGAYAAKGKSIGQVEAYGIWQQLVNTAAEIYQGGRGAKVTPMQLLTDTLKSVKGDEPTLPTRSVSKLDKAETFAALDKWASASTSLMRTLDNNEKQELFDILEKLNQGTVTTYKKVRNKKGQMENVQTTTPGLTPEKAQATVEQRLRELNPDDADRADRIRFADFLSGSVEGI
jgi:hypothetical protein